MSIECSHNYVFIVREASGASVFPWPSFYQCDKCGDIDRDAINNEASVWPQRKS